MKKYIAIILTLLSSIHAQDEKVFLSSIASYHEKNTENITYKVFLIDRGETIALNRYLLKVCIIKYGNEPGEFDVTVCDYPEPIERFNFLEEKGNLIFEIHQQVLSADQSNLELKREMSLDFSGDHPKFIDKVKK